MIRDLYSVLKRMWPRRHNNLYLLTHGNWFQRHGWDKGMYFYDDPEERWLYFKSNTRMMLRHIWPYPCESMSGEEAEIYVGEHGTIVRATRDTMEALRKAKRLENG